MEDVQETGYYEMKSKVLVASEVEFPGNRRRGIEGLHVISSLEEIDIANGRAQILAWPQLLPRRRFQRESHAAHPKCVLSPSGRNCTQGTTRARM